MDDPGVYYEVGRHVRERRKALGLTLEDLEAISGVSAPYIGQIERDVKQASLRTLASLAEALGLKVGALFNGGGPASALPSGKKIERILAAHPPRERALLEETLRHLAKGLARLKKR